MEIRKYGVQLIKEKSVAYMQEFITSTGTAKKILEVMFPDCHTWHNEKTGIICLDSQNRPCGVHLITSGTVNHASIYIREIAIRALLNNAVNIILFHNHPSGSRKPSSDDIETTKRTKTALKLLDITVVDHLILAEEDVYSMAEGGTI